MADYYVDNSVPGPGTGAFGDPWDAIATNINTLVAGDTMHVRGNVVGQRIYTEPVIDINVNGAVGNVITLKAYTGENVTIQESTGGGDIINVDGDYITIDRFTLDRNDQWPFAVDINGDHCTVQNCTIHSGGGDSLVSIDADYALIDTCTIHTAWKANDADAQGIWFESGYHSTIQNCTIYDICGDCISTPGPGPMGGITIDNCHLYTTLGQCSENAIDLKYGDATHPITISNCTMHGFRFCTATCGGSGSNIGAAIVMHENCENVIIEDNEIYDCASGLYSFSAPDVIIRRNVFRDLVKDANAWTNCAVYFTSTTGIEVYNNTFHACYDITNDRYVYRTSGTATVDKLYNNIFNDCALIQDDGNTNYDYNGWFNCTHTLSGPNDTTGADPMFVNEAGDDYHLAIGSPCIDVGTNVGLPYYGSAPDLGAFEYQPAAGSLVMVTVVIVVYTLVVTTTE